MIKSKLTLFNYAGSQQAGGCRRRCKLAMLLCTGSDCAREELRFLVGIGNPAGIRSESDRPAGLIDRRNMEIVTWPAVDRSDRRVGVGRRIGLRVSHSRGGFLRFLSNLRMFYGFLFLFLLYFYFFNLRLFSFSF